MRFIKTFEQAKSEGLDALYAVARGLDYDAFLKKTDSMTREYDILYRGMADGDSLGDQCFMTDWIGHAREYGEVVDGVIYDRKKDLLEMDDAAFNRLRRKLSGLTKNDIRKIYAPYFKSYKLFDAMDGKYETEPAVIDFVSNFIKSDVPYSKVQQKKIENDLLVPIMLHYAKSEGRNAIAFWGNDYADYGGALEFVVNDIGRYTTLKDIWKHANI